MAYTTGTAATRAAFHDALVNFMVTSAGWTLHDTVGATDKVLKSAGEDGKLNAILRISDVPTTAERRDAEHHFNYVHVRGYHSWTPGSGGSQEYGRWGPWAWMHSNNGRAGAYRTKMGTNSPLTLLTEVGSTLANVTNRFNGRRRIYFGESSATNSISFVDLFQGRRVTLGTHGLSTTAYVGGDVVFDDATGKDLYFAKLQIAASNWGYYDTETKTFTLLADHSASTAALQACIWDGADYVYTWMTGTTTFKRFKLSTGTWESLANSPHNAGTGTTADRATCAVYIPASTGYFPNDVILIAWGSSSGGKEIIRYNVGLNTWGPTITAPWPTQASHVVWDGGKYLWIFNQGGPYAARLDLSDPLGRFQGVLFPQPDTTSFGSQTAQMGMHYISPIVSKVRAPDPSGRYWFFGNKDNIVVVTRQYDKYFWCSFGRFDPQAKPHVTTTTAPIGSGIVDIPVISSTGFIEGDKILLYDPVTGRSQGSVVTGLPAANTIRANVLDPMPTGTQVGMDVNPVVLTGDSHAAVTALDAHGFESDSQGAGYRVRPAAPITFLSSTANARGQIACVPLQFYTSQPEWSATNEIRGTLKNIFAVRKGTRLPGEPVIINGKTYINFPQFEMLYDSNDFDVLVGPID